MNSFGVLQALVFEPKKAFESLDVRPRVLFPLIALIICSAGLIFWYYQVADLGWATDQQIRSSGLTRALTEAQIDAAVKRAGDHPVRSGVISAAAAALVIVLFRLVEALYYMLAGKMTGVQRDFRHWLSLACWSSLPSLLAVIPAGIMLATATTAQIDQNSLQSLSLNNLLFHRVAGDPGYSLLTNFNLLYVLGAFYAALGIRAWSKRSWLHAIVIAFLPMVVVFGPWALIVMGRS
jgi:Yip1 domain